MVHYSKPGKLYQNKCKCKQAIYHWIIHHPQVVQSTIANDCLKESFDGHTET